VGSASEGNTPYNRADSGGSQSISESQNWNTWVIWPDLFNIPPDPRWTWRRILSSFARMRLELLNLEDLVQYVSEFWHSRLHLQDPTRSRCLQREGYFISPIENVKLAVLNCLLKARFKGWVEVMSAMYSNVRHLNTVLTSLTIISIC
jgi:hypothetical protein